MRKKVYADFPAMTSIGFATFTNSSPWLCIPLLLYNNVILTRHIHYCTVYIPVVNSCRADSTRENCYCRRTCKGFRIKPRLLFSSCGSEMSKSSTYWIWGALNSLPQLRTHVIHICNGTTSHLMNSRSSYHSEPLLLAATVLDTGNRNRWGTLNFIFNKPYWKNSQKNSK